MGWCGLGGTKQALQGMILRLSTPQAASLGYLEVCDESKDWGEVCGQNCLRAGVEGYPGRNPALMWTNREPPPRARETETRETSLQIVGFRVETAALAYLLCFPPFLSVLQVCFGCFPLTGVRVWIPA